LRQSDRGILRLRTGGGTTKGRRQSPAHEHLEIEISQLAHHNRRDIVRSSEDWVDLASRGCRSQKKPFMVSSPADSSSADVASEEAILQNPAALRDLLAAPSYIWFWIGRVSNSLSVQIQAIALAWQVYAVARNTASVNQAALAVGMLGLAQFLPMIALTLFAGHAADRYDRRKIMIAGLAVQVCTSALFGAMASGSLTVLWPIYGVAAVFGAARAFYQPASAALVPSLVERRLMPRAIVFNAAGNQTATIVGPAIGGLLVAASPLAAFAASGALCLLSLMTLLLVSSPPSQIRPTASRWTLIAEGLRYVWNTKIVLGAISLDLFAVLLGGATALLPVYARDILHVGPEGYGVLRAAPASGALISGFVLAARPLKSQAGLKMFLAVGVFGLCTVVFALSRSIVLSALALATLGAADMVSVFVRQTLVQIVTPDPMRGRVSAVSSLFIGASNELGEFESGGMARLLGPVGSALFGGCGAIVVTLLWAVMFPALRKADKLE
jgi:MFS family permease